MANYMKNVAEMLGVEINEEFIVTHDEGRSTVKLTTSGLKFVNHLGTLKEDAPAICLKEILNGNFQIEHINKTSSDSNVPNVLLVEGCDEELFINGKSVCVHKRLYPSDVLSALADNRIITYKREER